MKHLTYSDRIKIEAMKKLGVTNRVIADTLGFHYNTICNDVKRGLYDRLDTHLRARPTYSADIAQSKADYAATAKGATHKLGNDYDFVNFISVQILKHRKSPYAALQLAKLQQFKTQICLATLYTYIRDGLIPGVTQKQLPYAPRVRSYNKVRKAAVKNVLYPRIHERPEEIDARNTFGHWELDTVIGKQGTRACFMVLTERLTRYEIIMKLSNKKQESVKAALDTLEKKNKHFAEIFKTITCDNGCEFSPEAIETSVKGGKRTRCFFCHPYSSWERGSNENANRLIRRFYPKGTNLTPLSKVKVSELNSWINNYPRRIFNGMSSAQLIKNFAKITI